jgi:DNA anti-recombination protein RmuC
VTVEQDVAAAKQCVRELHEAIQEARDVQKELRVTVEELHAVVKDYGADLQGVLSEEAQKNLEVFQTQVKEHTEQASKAVMHRFDEIANILLGEGKKARRRGDTSLVDLAVEVTARNG